jgi:hypothetical protein
MPILIPLTAPHSSLSSGAGTVDQLVAVVPSGLGFTSPQEKKLPVSQKTRSSLSTRDHILTQPHPSQFTIECGHVIRRVTRTDDL